MPPTTFCEFIVTVKGREEGGVVTVIPGTVIVPEPIKFDDCTLEKVRLVDVVATGKVVGT